MAFISWLFTGLKNAEGLFGFFCMDWTNRDGGKPVRSAGLWQVFRWSFQSAFWQPRLQYREALQVAHVDFAGFSQAEHFFAGGSAMAVCMTPPVKISRAHPTRVLKGCRAPYSDG